MLCPGGPFFLLFLLMMLSKLFLYLVLFVARLYADDAMLFSNNPSQLQHALDCFSFWICEYQLCLAPAKCAHLAFSRLTANNMQNVFHINSEPVQTTSKARDLGVLVTDNLKWSSHNSYTFILLLHILVIVLRAFSTKNIWTLLKIYVT